MTMRGLADSMAMAFCEPNPARLYMMRPRFASPDRRDSFTGSLHFRPMRNSREHRESAAARLPLRKRPRLRDLPSDPRRDPGFSPERGTSSARAMALTGG